jgi:hypothetical protein
MGKKWLVEEVEEEDSGGFYFWLFVLLGLIIIGFFAAKGIGLF